MYHGCADGPRAVKKSPRTQRLAGAAVWSDPLLPRNDVEPWARTTNLAGRNARSGCRGSTRSWTAACRLRRRVTPSEACRRESAARLPAGLAAQPFLAAPVLQIGEPRLMTPEIAEYNPSHDRRQAAPRLIVDLLECLTHTIAPKQSNASGYSQGED